MVNVHVFKKYKNIVQIFFRIEEKLVYEKKKKN